MNKLPLSWLLPLAAVIGLGACGDTRLCKSGTLFVTIDFQGAALGADNLLVAVTPDGDPPRQNVFPHAPGTATGSVEIDFPAGYQVGRHVQVVLTAQKAGADVATVTGSVVLAAGCSTFSIRVGGGGNDGGGTDVPAGTGGVPGADGGPGTGGTTGTGGTPGTDGGGSGGRIDGGNDVACVFQSAEDCFNGIDDDCNGHTDCDDPACVPATECVPAGNSNFALGIQADAPATCPPNFTGPETPLNQGLILPAGTSCTGCACNAKTTCSIGLYAYATMLACTADLGKTGGTLVGQLLNSDTLACEPTTLSAPSYRVGNYIKTDTPCTPAGTGALPPVTWITQKKFCAQNSVGGGCAPGYVCAPKRPVATDHCVRADGALSCPAGYVASGSGWFKGIADTRTCGVCTCGAQTAGDCTKQVIAGSVFNRNLQFWSPNNCPSNLGQASTVSAVPGSQSCCPLLCAANGCPSSSGGVACTSFGINGAPLQASCPPSSAIAGAATASGSETLCCRQ